MISDVQIRKHQQALSESAAASASASPSPPLRSPAPNRQTLPIPPASSAVRSPSPPPPLRPTGTASGTASATSAAAASAPAAASQPARGSTAKTGPLVLTGDALHSAMAKLHHVAPSEPPAAVAAHPPFLPFPTTDLNVRSRSPSRSAPPPAPSAVSSRASIAASSQSALVASSSASTASSAATAAAPASSPLSQALAALPPDDARHLAQDEREIERLMTQVRFSVFHRSLFARFVQPAVCGRSSAHLTSCRLSICPAREPSSLLAAVHCAVPTCAMTCAMQNGGRHRTMCRRARIARGSAVSHIVGKGAKRTPLAAEGTMLATFDPSVARYSRLGAAAA